MTLNFSSAAFGQNREFGWVEEDAKLMLIDGSTALLGSINLSNSSLDLYRELAVILRDPEILQTLAQSFSSDWNSATAF